MNNDVLLSFSPAADEFQDQVIAITGAGDGIGRALALACAAAGATTLLIGENIKKLESVYDEIEASNGPQAAIYPMDFVGTNVNDYQDLADNIEQQLGKLDALVCNAGWLGGFRPFTQIKPEEYLKIMNINLHAPFWIANSCMPLLQKSNNGALLFSTHTSDLAYYGAFGVAKHGIEGLVKILAHEFSGETSASVNVNGIDSGPINTQMRRTHFPGEDWSLLAEPESVIPAYLYLLSSQGKSLTGHNIKLAKPSN